MPQLKIIAAFRHRQRYGKTSGSVSFPKPGAIEGKPREGRAQEGAASEPNLPLFGINARCWAFRLQLTSRRHPRWTPMTHNKPS